MLGRHGLRWMWLPVLLIVLALSWRHSEFSERAPISGGGAQRTKHRDWKKAPLRRARSSERPIAPSPAVAGIDLVLEPNPDGSLTMASPACTRRSRVLTLPERRGLTLDEREAVRGVLDSLRERIEMRLDDEFGEPSAGGSVEDVYLLTSLMEEWSRYPGSRRREILARLGGVEENEPHDRFVNVVRSVLGENAQGLEEIRGLLGTRQADDVWFHVLTWCAEILRPEAIDDRE